MFFFFFFVQSTIEKQRTNFNGHNKFIALGKTLGCILHRKQTVYHGMVVHSLGWVDTDTHFFVFCFLLSGMRLAYLLD